MYFISRDGPTTERWNDTNWRNTGYRSPLTSSRNRPMREARRIRSRRGLPLRCSHASFNFREGIVKIGISVLVSSISIPKPSFSFKFTPYSKPSVTFHGRRWLGARILDNAGFKPVGTVAPLIAMDGTRYTAEMRLMEILKEKHIEDPERLSVEWKSAEWIVMLVLCTMVAAVSVIPYIALISPHFRPSVVHSPWIFPLLRTVGGSLAAICCQFLIQSRVISLMKNRIIFMIMNRILLDDLKSKSNNPDLDIRSQNVFRWDENLPSEECLWNLEQYLRPRCSTIQPSDSPNEGLDNSPASPSIEPFATGERQDHPRDVTIQMDTLEISEPPPDDSSIFTTESGIPSPDLSGSQSDVPVVSSIELQDQSHVSITKLVRLFAVIGRFFRAIYLEGYLPF